MASEESKLINPEPTNDNPVTNEPQGSKPAPPAPAKNDAPPVIAADDDD